MNEYLMFKAWEMFTLITHMPPCLEYALVPGQKRPVTKRSTAFSSLRFKSSPGWCTRSSAPDPPSPLPHAVPPARLVSGPCHLFSSLPLLPLDLKWPPGTTYPGSLSSNFYHYLNYMPNAPVPHVSGSPQPLLSLLSLKPLIVSCAFTYCPN